MRKPKMMKSMEIVRFGIIFYWNCISLNDSKKVFQQIAIINYTIMHDKFLFFIERMKLIHKLPTKLKYTISFNKQKIKWKAIKAISEIMVFPNDSCGKW